MNTAEQSGTGFDLLFWYVLRKENERQGCMADFKFFEKALTIKHDNEARMVVIFYPSSLNRYPGF